MSSLAQYFMAILQFTLSSLFIGKKSSSANLSLNDILNLYRQLSKANSLALEKCNAAYDMYENTLFVWLEITDKRLEEKVYKLQDSINKKIKSSGLRVFTTVMNDWSGLPIPDKYNPMF